MLPVSSGTEHTKMNKIYSRNIHDYCFAVSESSRTCARKTYEDAENIFPEHTRLHMKTEDASNIHRALDHTISPLPPPSLYTPSAPVPIGPPEHPKVELASGTSCSHSADSLPADPCPRPNTPNPGHVCTRLSALTFLHVRVHCRALDHAVAKVRIEPLIRSEDDATS